jgi:hypothetical protein
MDESDRMTNAREFTSVKVFHLMVRKCSGRMMVRDVIQEIWRGPQTQITTQERRSPIHQPDKLDTKHKKPYI